MTWTIYVIDAFTSEAFTGNPAAVVFGPFPERLMQELAAEMKHSETAFLARRDDQSYDLRWFTPEVEVDLCGHATLASMHALAEEDGEDRATFHTRSGELQASRADDGAITLDFPIAPSQPEPPNPELYAALGVTDVVDFLRTDGDFFCCVVESAEAVRDLRPDFARLRAVPGVRGVYVTARAGGAYDIVSRCFAPLVGIDEDPVTGSMHSALVGYWAPRIGTDELRALQASPRGGVLTVVRKGDRALLTGYAKTVLRGDLLPDY